MKFPEHDIQDKNFLRYIKRFLIAGIAEIRLRRTPEVRAAHETSMEDGKVLESDRGTPQGGLISPILANVYLHYVLDLWFEKAVKPKLKGEAYYARYADDFLILFQYENEAEAVLGMLRERLGKFSLEVAEDKTRILPIGRFRGTKEEFDFLGFTFFNTKTREGKYRLGIRTSKKELKAKRQAAKAWVRSRMIRPISETMKKMAAIIRGHCGCYGVNGNLRSLYKFHDYMMQMTRKMLNRRSQRGCVTYKKFQRIWDYYVTPPKITKDIWQWKPKTV